jgi:hypothetical protein
MSLFQHYCLEANWQPKYAREVQGNQIRVLKVTHDGSTVFFSNDACNQKLHLVELNQNKS